MTLIGTLNDKINSAAWGTPMILLLILGGCISSHASGWVQLRHMKHAMKSAAGGMLGKRRRGDGTLSQFEAVSTALAGTVGTGNITGVAVALSLGGPGAVFWMWVSALIGMGTKYAEILLAVKFRERNKNGEYCGGPMYYIKNGLPGFLRWMAPVFCVFGAAASFGIGNMMQTGSIMDALEDTASLFSPAAGQSVWLKASCGALLAAAAALSMRGSGASGRGKTSALIVPFMAAVYVAGAILVITANIRNLPSAFAQIIGGAFSPAAVCGSAAGEGLKKTVEWGFRRGMFSHEAGLGSSPIAHGSADAESPVKQGFLGIFEVFTDTVVICTLTALMILCSGVPMEYGVRAGASCVIAALSTVMPPAAASLFMSVSVLLFAFSSIVGWSLYGERCTGYLLGERAVKPYRATFITAVFLSSMMEFSQVIKISDTLNAMMAIPNVAAITVLAPTVKRETDEYFRRCRE